MEKGSPILPPLTVENPENLMYLAFEPLNEAAMQADVSPRELTAQDKALIQRMEGRINAALQAIDQQAQDDLARALFNP